MILAGWSRRHMEEFEITAFKLNDLGLIEPKSLTIVDRS